MALSPTSNVPERRAKQLANLQRGGPSGAQPGNRRAWKHGVYAQITEAELDVRTRELFEAVGEMLPVRDADGGVPVSDVLVTRMLAETMIRRERVRVEELRHGLEAPDGSLRGIVEYGLRLDERALALAKELGLTPASRAKLGLDLARTHRTLEDEIAAAPDWDDVVDGEAAA
jgi:hypothetical protein